MQSPSIQTIYGLDLLRGIVALSVVVHHIRIIPFFFLDDPAVIQQLHAQLQTMGLSLLYEWTIAVPVFWALSGFIITLIYGAATVSLKTFLVGRISRILPLYFLTFTVTLVVFLIALHTNPVMPRTLGLIPQNVLLNLTMTTGWGLGGQDSMNFPSWSVSAEMPIYILFGVLVAWLGNLRLPHIVIVLVAMILLATFQPLVPLILKCGLFFFVGAITALLFQYLGTRSTILASAAVLVVCGGIMVLRNQLGLPQWSRNLVLSIAIASIILEIAKMQFPQNIWMRKVALCAGDWSYGIYLWHIPVVLAVLLVAEECCSDLGWMYTYPTLILYLLTVTAIAALCHRFFEKPVRALIRKRFDIADARVRHAGQSAPVQQR